MPKNKTPTPDKVEQEILDSEQSEAAKFREFMAKGRAAIKESKRVSKEKRLEAVKALASKTGIEPEILAALT